MVLFSKDSILNLEERCDLEHTEALGGNGTLESEE